MEEQREALRSYVDVCYKKEAYVRYFDSVIYPVNGPDLWEKTDFDDVMSAPYRKPSHRPIKKRKRGLEKAEDRKGGMHQATPPCKCI
ncbi:hypothetical protein Ahy_A09g045316 [Arachis hypogaea]|uniref:Uncharacterized protein n=1 Tax=Arachis hypogaea TaxID=3818 RepID=A0A445BM44_ARAHY|nr:hypothetical protein Ahy_A09g045316 [Arachis hypogaea]